MTLDIAQVVERDEVGRLEVRRQVLTGTVLLVNLVFLLVPAVVGSLALLGLLR